MRCDRCAGLVVAEHFSAGVTSIGGGAYGEWRCVSCGAMGLSMIALRIAAKVDPADQEYFHAEIEPLLADPLIEYIGEITDAEKDEFLGNATALVCPYDWPEPFGLVLIEALACGTPVLAYRRGSIPEIIEDGVTGFVCEGLDEMTAAIQRIPEIDRQRCRKTFEQRFSAERMAQNYIRVYEQALGNTCKREAAAASFVSWSPTLSANA